jgi:hypothetical protein
LQPLVDAVKKYVLGAEKLHGDDTAQPMAVRVQCMSESLPYLFPKLQSQTVALTGPNGDGPVEVATLERGRHHHATA